MQPKILFIILLIGIAVQAKPQPIPNGDFENWTNLSPDGWKSNSCPLCDPPYNTYIVVRDSDACQGVYSSKFINNTINPSWASVKFATSIHPANLYACIRSLIQIGDSALIEITVHHNGLIVDKGRWVNKLTIPNYTVTEILVSQAVAYVDSVEIKITGGTKDSTTLNADNLSFSPITKITELKDVPSFTIQPNPFSDYTYLYFKNPPREKYTITIYNVMGQLVRTIKNIYDVPIKIEKGKMTKGLYFLQLNDDTGWVGTANFIID
jgi:hypothetical protein